MTRTCEPCNVRLGSLVEPALSQWFHVELPSARFRSAGFHGTRSAGHVLIRTTTDGRPVPFLDGRHHSDVDAMLAAGGPVVLEGLLPDANLCWLALLKHSYLSFCLKYGPPTGYIADLIRRDLIAARNARTRDAVHTSVLAPRLTVGRGEPISDAPPVSEAIRLRPRWAGPQRRTAGRLPFVSWTFDMQSDPLWHGIGRSGRTSRSGRRLEQVSRPIGQADRLRQRSDNSRDPTRPEPDRPAVNHPA